ncbi:HAD family hydrolase [Reinekea marinisedimentorum]|uniref:HAD superfamily hydrolase (TIGR01509 family)/HAD superfamily hydrolase (TIGR01549 family) n=1 Tax=Reinekea marinisedimentorum TaxID=230495 RepID=A0A4R3I9W9_9GAMM|nr:HAD family phosphatase [Reinekea marinisedimentorum]TCS42678.1 HAD superfamily hydrolase (TIGR01509 family)/HAD superfamily hydrolase (TIGR01549 family) [Reinekea marinisedimentorum]
MTIQAVLWDMDGVLLDSERLCQQAFVDVNGPSGLFENPAEAYLETVGLNRKSTLEWYSRVMGSQQACEAMHLAVRDRYLELIETDLVLKNGAQETLAFLAQRQIPQMVVTSSAYATAQDKLTRAGIVSFFEGIVGGDQVTNGKPNAEPYLTACAHLDVSPENCLVVEDSPSGVQAGLAAGAKVVHVPDLLPTSDEWREQLICALASLEHFPGWFDHQFRG